MKYLSRNKRFFQAVSILCAVLFAGSGFAAAMGSARIIPNGKVAVYEGQVKVGVLTAESPLPEGKILKTEGKCGVKMDSLYLVATDKSEMMVNTPESGRQLLVREGQVYFGITAMPRPMTLATPRGAVGIQQVLLNASADNALLKGYVSVTEETAEIGVIEGGAMILATAEGEKRIDSGQRFILAQGNVPIDKISCKSDADCPEGYICQGNKCVKSKPVGGLVPSGTGAAIFAGGTLLAIPLIGNALSDDDDNASPKQ